ncbi:hypothetical protein X771_25340 [Mesorhizobium sp. LSJC277A00]|nr:hypothetical protein X771_25340 [Mesorhizobium sp. LSJC277A00]
MWHPALLTRRHFMPILATTAATIRVWLDCTPPMLGDAVELLSGRGPKGERITFELFQHVLSGNTRWS